MKQERVNLDEVERLAKNAILRYLIFNDISRIDTAPRNGAYPVPSSGPSHDLSLMIETIFEEEFDRFTGPLGNTTYGDMIPVFEHFLILSNNRLRLMTHTYIGVDGTETSHPLFYWLDQGVEKTVFPNGTPGFEIYIPRRTSPSRVRPTQGRFEKTFAFPPGATRPELPAMGWSRTVAERVKDALNSSAEANMWHSSQILIKVVSFSGGGA